MKSIINSLLAILIISLIAMGFSSKQNNTKQVLIQTTDNRISPDDLSRSVEIITNRLKSFSTEKFEISAIPAKNQIKVIMDNSWDMNLAISLITQKGTLEFYETYNYKDVTGLFKGDSMLMTLNNGKAPVESSPRIGFTTFAAVPKADKYLNSLCLDQKCKFVWSNLFDDSVVGLYALKLDNGKEVIIKGADIEKFTSGHDSTRNQDYISFSFKKSAVQLWADITKRNIGNAIAMVLDGKVIFAPVVWDEIPNGNCTVTGGFTTTQVKYIVAIGANEELPINFKVVN